MYLPDDIFVKTDRASMYYSIETRAPFVDRRLVKFTSELNYKYKINGLKSKVLIRKLSQENFPGQDPDALIN